VIRARGGERATGRIVVESPPSLRRSVPANCMAYQSSPCSLIDVYIRENCRSGANSVSTIQGDHSTAELLLVLGGRLAIPHHPLVKPRVMEIRLLVDAKTILGECPLWDVQSQRLYWVDSHDGRIFQATAEGREIKQWTLPSTIGSMALRRNAGAVVSLRSGLHLFDFESGRSEPIAHPEEGTPGVRLNDGKVDPQGRFVVGSFDETLFGPEPSPVPRGSLYRLDSDLSLTTLEQGVGVANGPCWSPNGRRFYFADTWAKTVWCYDWKRYGRTRRRNGGLGRVSLECVGRHRRRRWRRPPLYSGRPARPTLAAADIEGDQCHVRRT